MTKGDQDDAFIKSLSPPLEDMMALEYPHSACSVHHWLLGLMLLELSFEIKDS